MSPEPEPSLAELEAALGYSFDKRGLLEQALLHRSFRFEEAAVDHDNQRLEFLGDAALGLVAAAYLYSHFVEEREGTLTLWRSRITSGKALTQIARKLGLGQFLRVGKGEDRSGGRHRASNLADALESILGAAYLDGGIEAVERIFAALFANEIEASVADLWVENPKGKLQEISQQQWQTSPRYTVVEQSGPAHDKIFVIEVEVNDEVVGAGRGSTKRQAQAAAAMEGIKKLAERPGLGVDISALAD